MLRHQGVTVSVCCSVNLLQCQYAAAFISCKLSCMKIGCICTAAVLAPYSLSGCSAVACTAIMQLYAYDRQETRAHDNEQFSPLASRNVKYFPTGQERLVAAWCQAFLPVLADYKTIYTIASPQTGNAVYCMAGRIGMLLSAKAEYTQRDSVRINFNAQHVGGMTSAGQCHRMADPQQASNAGNCNAEQLGGPSSAKHPTG